MGKLYLFLRKLVTLSILISIFFLLKYFKLDIPHYITLPLFALSFSFIVSKITGTVPRELFNFNRSETYFNLGGLRDLIRIPVVLFAFIQNTVVWAIWGVIQVFVLFNDFIYFIKQTVFFIIKGLFGFLKLLLPFWRLLYRLIVYYQIKWPWWIYNYSFKTIRKTFNWNILRVSGIGAFIGLFIFQLFYFIEITWDIAGIRFIGAVLTLLPASWSLGEIAAIRGQHLMHVPFKEIRKQYGNGVETLRSMLFFITLFVVLVLVQLAIPWMGWVKNSGILLFGITVNISFLLSIVMLFLLILIVFGTIIIPTYRLYNEFNETSLRSVRVLLRYISNRFAQFISGLVSGSIFASISAVPALIVVSLALFITLQFKDFVLNLKTNSLSASLGVSQLDDYRINKRINHLQYLNTFPNQLFYEMEHRKLLQDELRQYKEDLNSIKKQLQSFKEESSTRLKELERAIVDEQEKMVINQTRLEEYQQEHANLTSQSKKKIVNFQYLIETTSYDLEFGSRKDKQLPIVFYLSGFFICIVLTPVFAFLLGYFGNLFYKSYLFNNDGDPAYWKNQIRAEKEIDRKQPLLAVSLNILLVGITILLIATYLNGKWPVPFNKLF